jgi:hypothetical protein
MKTKMNYLILLVFSIAFVLTSCKKDEETPAASNEEAVASAVDDNSATTAEDNVYSEADATATQMDETNNWTNTTKTKSVLADSVKQITITSGSGDTTVWPKTITITFTNWKARGHILDGTITMTQTNRMVVVNAERSINMDVIIDDTIRVQGVRTVTNLGLVDGKPSMNVKLEDGKITNLNSQKFITRNADHTRTWEGGFGRLSRFNVLDDEWSITGIATGTNRFGHTYTNTIKEKLMFKTICPFIVNGKLEIAISGKQPFTIDYGYPIANNCDRKFRVTVGGATTNVE